MSKHSQSERITIPKIRETKGAGSLVSLTAYTTQMARLMDPFVDIIVVGDSLGMVAYGMPSTLQVTLEMMIGHGAAVMRGASRACVIIDMPFSSYQESPQQAYRNSARAMAETGAQGIKLEGGAELLETVDFLVARGIPVMPHIGLKPQHTNVMGGFKAQIKTAAEMTEFVELARAFETRGAFSILIEGTYEEAARKVTQAVRVPTIGIGASPECDGQILVTEDILGMFPDFMPKFAERYVDLSAQITDAVKRFSQDVRAKEFPAAKHCFGIKR